MQSENRRQPRRICLSIHTTAEAIRVANPGMLETESLKLAKDQYDARWHRNRKPTAK